MAFKYVGQDPTGCERWVDSATGDVQLRNCPSAAEISTYVSQSTPAKDPYKETLTAAELNRINNIDLPGTTSKSNTGIGSPKEVTPTDGTAIRAPSQIGVGAASDDKGTTNTYVPSASTASTVVTPAPNALDQYASYTYSLSWYLLTPEQGTALSESGKLTTNEWTLLMQSGGAPIKERSKYFMLDYYMDNLEIETSYLEDTIASVNSLSFTVTEPNGITLLANLNKAARELYKQDISGLADKAFYVMVIRFYGWDANGSLITKTSPAAGASNTLNTTNAAVIKFYPFVITAFTFTAASKAVEYKITAAAREVKYAMSSALGSVPHPIELVGETVDDILNGSIVAVKAGDDSKRTTSSTPPGSTRDSLATSVFTGGAINDTGIGFNVGATPNGA
jgi:hypothetical protein